MEVEQVGKDKRVGVRMRGGHVGGKQQQGVRRSRVSVSSMGVCCGVRRNRVSGSTRY